MLDLTDLPDEEWKQSRAAYLSLTPGIKQGAKSFYTNRFPKFELRQFNYPEFTILEDGKVQAKTDFTWRVKYQYYAGIDSRSYFDWPNYATQGWMPTGLFEPGAPMHVVTESGQAIYIRVSEQRRWQHDRHPEQIYALWKSEGTIKPRKVTSKTSQDEALLKKYHVITLGEPNA